MDLQKSRIACVGMLAATVSFAVAKESPLSLPPGVKEKIDALVQAQPAQRVTPGIAVAISKNGQTIYENTNYNLLGLVIERASGQSYIAFLREHIFSPLGMSSTSTIDQPPANMASGYHHEKPGEPFVTRAELHPDFSFRTGNLVSTTQ